MAKIDKKIVRDRVFSDHHTCNLRHGERLDSILVRFRVSVCKVSGSVSVSVSLSFVLLGIGFGIGFAEFRSTRYRVRFRFR